MANKGRRFQISDCFQLPTNMSCYIVHAPSKKARVVCVKMVHLCQWHEKQ